MEAQRTRHDLEMLNEIGFTKGIENYSRHLSGRKPGEPPPTLLDYLPPNALMFIDESHVTAPQIGGMYKGDRARKEKLVNYGFRLLSTVQGVLIPNSRSLMVFAAYIHPVRISNRLVVM